MNRLWLAGAAFAVLLAILFLAARRTPNQRTQASGNSDASSTSSTPQPVHPSFLYGRIVTIDGANYTGRLRWGGHQEAFWGDYFNGSKRQNTWAAFVPPERLPKEIHAIEFFGIELGRRSRPSDLGRYFMARFGDVARIEASTRQVRVKLKSGTVAELDRFSASDFDDGVRVWDDAQGVTDLDTLRIRSIELLAPPLPGAAPNQLHGTVRTRHGTRFTGFLQWDREQCLGSDELAGGEHTIRFDRIRSIARRSSDSSIVTLIDGREIVLEGVRAAGEGNRGVYVDDRRYGRVLVSWNAFERVEFSSGGNGPAYNDFPPGSPITGAVITRDGRRLTGRLVYDLDESEFTETLDAPMDGVDYTIPFGLIASIVLRNREVDSAHRRAEVTLHSGEKLRLDLAGDLGEAHAGMLVFGDGQRTEYVPWSGVEEVTFARPAAMYPPVGKL